MAHTIVLTAEQRQVKLACLAHVAQVMKLNNVSDAEVSAYHYWLSLQETAADLSLNDEPTTAADLHEAILDDDGDFGQRDDFLEALVDLYPDELTQTSKR